MRHIPNNSRMHVPVVHTRHDKRAATADDCVACDVRTAYNMLAHSIEILRAARAGETAPLRRCRQMQQHRPPHEG